MSEGPPSSWPHATAAPGATPAAPGAAALAGPGAAAGADGGPRGPAAEPALGVALTQIGQTPVPTARALAIGGALARALTALHDSGFVHLNLRPEHILVHGEAGGDDTVSLAGLDLAVRASWQQPAVVDRAAWQAAAGLPAYASPELCGRVNARIDERSDLYSVGCVLFELLQGQPPFPQGKAADVVHAHLARAPAAIDSPAGRVVGKLLAKGPRERYQTARGLEFDLAACARGEPLEALGSRDALDRFADPARLYGRDEAVAQLMGLHAHVTAPGASKRTHFALVAGYSGVGKTALVAEMLRRVGHTGMHASGKFQQLRHHGLPYSAIAQAVSALVRQLLRGSQARLDEWRQELAEATGDETRVLVEIVPELRAVLGAEAAQAPLPSLPPAEGKARFERVFLQFLSTLGRPGAPLVVLLDDLQWADVASLALIELMLSRDGVSHVLIVGAYRDNEVGPDHPLQRILERVHAPDLALALPPLTPESVGELVAAILRGRAAPGPELVAVVHEKTHGNPFFVRQFLGAARDAGVLRFDFEAERWQFDAAAAARLSNTDNVVDLLARKISTLPGATQTALRTAACFGGRVGLATLVTILARPESEVLDHLQAAIGAGLVQLVGDADDDDEVLFVHDRVQQAAYEATPAEERPALHLSVGRLLLPTLREDSEAQELFAVADHINAAIDSAELAADAELCQEAARLNVRASERAEASMAHASALAYAQFGKRLAGDQPWPDLFKRLMTSAMLNGRLDESAAAVNEALVVYEGPAGVQFLQHLVVLHTLQGDYGAGIATAKRALGLLGVVIPEEADEVAAALDEEVALNFSRLRWV